MKKKPILIAAFILGSFSVGGVGLVAMTNELTQARIIENQREAMLSKLRAIVPAERMTNDPLTDKVLVHDEALLGVPTSEVMRVRDGDDPVALVLQPVVPDGYAGPIRLLVAVLHDGTLGGVRVLSHYETPGLGDQIEERKDDWIVEQFNGRSLRDPPPEQWLVKRDGGVFDQFTGATITPRSVVQAVKSTLLFVEQHGDQLYDLPALGAPPSVDDPPEHPTAPQVTASAAASDPPAAAAPPPEPAALSAALHAAADEAVPTASDADDALTDAGPDDPPAALAPPTSATPATAAADRDGLDATTGEEDD